MPTIRKFGKGRFTIEVTTRNSYMMAHVIAGVVDVYGDGQRWSFARGTVIVDFGFRAILEGPDADLNYRVLDGSEVLISVEGPRDDRRHTGGIRRGKGAYSF